MNEKLVRTFLLPCVKRNADWEVKIMFAMSQHLIYAFDESFEHSNV